MEEDQREVIELLQAYEDAQEGVTSAELDDG